MPHVRPHPTPVQTRRGFLGLVAGGGLVLLGANEPAQAAGVSVGDLRFELPDQVLATPAGPEVGGSSWQWRGVRRTSEGSDPSVIVLARADLPSTDAGEVLGLLLAGSLSGALPGLSVEVRRSRETPGGGDQLRLDLSYAAPGAGMLGGTLLVAARPRPPAAALVVLGDSTLTAQDVATVLDSARWVS
ncbi:MAG: hypothetical protein ACRYG2_25075 [Janthinobacterium lividum]